MSQAQKWAQTTMNAMLSLRMGWNVSEPANPFTVSLCYRANDEVAVVFLIWQGRYTAVEDQLELFPSDALVTKLRLLIG